VLLDKTGTLTAGRPRVVATRGSEEALACAAALEARSTHPLARAIARRGISPTAITLAAPLLTALVCAWFVRSRAIVPFCLLMGLVGCLDALDGAVARVSGRVTRFGAYLDAVCDRYVDSSVAYQGVARGLGLERVLDLNLSAVGGLLPDRTFLLSLDIAQLPGRLRREHDRLERESDDFHALAGAGYRELAARFPERIVVLDATLPAETIAEEVYGALRVRS